MKFSLYTWIPSDIPDSLEANSSQQSMINNLEPTFCYTVPRPG